MTQKKILRVGIGAGRHDCDFTLRATPLHNNSMQKHKAFFLDELLPAVVNHAHRIDVSSDEAALVSLMALGSVLQTKGFDADILLTAIQGSAPAIHDTPEGLQ